MRKEIKSEKLKADNRTMQGEVAARDEKYWIITNGNGRVTSLYFGLPKTLAILPLVICSLKRNNLYRIPMFCYYTQQVFSF